MSPTSVDAPSQSRSSLSSPPDKSDETYRFIGHVSEIGTEAHILLDDLNTLKGRLTAPDFNLDQIADSWRDLEMKIYQNDDTKVRMRLTEVKNQMEMYPVLLEHHGRHITMIENYWERLDSSWPKFPENGEPDLRVLLHRIDDAHDLLVCVLCRVGMVTIVSLVNEQLETIRVGQFIDFHATFSEIIPDQASRQLALQYLYKHVLSIKGAIDVEHGIIYRASPNVWYRRLSPVYITLLAIFGGGIVYMSYPFLQTRLPNLPEDAFGLLVVYICIMAGGLIHTAVDSIKQYRQSKEQSFTALGDLVLWIHVKQFPIMVSILTLWIVFIGFVAVGLGADWQTALFVGYSFDSFFDIFLQRFSVATSTRTTAIQSRLTTTAPRTATA